MAKEISKNSSQQASQHIVETNKDLAIDGKHHSVETNGLVVSLISILETHDAMSKHNYQC
jgi:hypothetical protein